MLKDSIKIPRLHDYREHTHKSVSLFIQGTLNLEVQIIAQGGQKRYLFANRKLGKL
jgi:hypothetical protein